MTRHLIVGAGPAGLHAIETIRALEPDAEIDLVSGEPAYARMVLAEDVAAVDALGLEAFELLDESAWQGQIMVQLGINAGRRGRFEEAKTRFERAMETARPRGDLLRLGTALVNLGHVHSMLGNVIHDCAHQISMRVQQGQSMSGFKVLNNGGGNEGGFPNA